MNEEFALSDLNLKIDEIPESGVEIHLSEPACFLNLKDERFEVTGDIAIEGKLIRAGEDVFFEGMVQASLSMDCGRCLKKIKKDINIDVKERFKPGVKDEEDQTELHDDDLNTSEYNNEMVDILPVIQDQISLSVPIKPLCSEECKGLCPHCGIDLNMKICSCKTDEIDPRLEVLKQLTKTSV